MSAPAIPSLDVTTLLADAERPDAAATWQRLARERAARTDAANARLRFLAGASLVTVAREYGPLWLGHQPEAWRDAADEVAGAVKAFGEGCGALLGALLRVVVLVLLTGALVGLAPLALLIGAARIRVNARVAVQRLDAVRDAHAHAPADPPIPETRRII